VAARSPWSANEVIVLIVLEAVALIATVAAWYVSSITHDPVDQIPWLVVGILGVVVGSMAGMMFLIQGRRAVGARFWAAAAQVELAPLGPSTSSTMDAEAASTTALVAVAGTQRFHRSDCVLVAGKRVHEATAKAHRGHGRAACPVCLPMLP
jgi:hypothetical protein